MMAINPLFMRNHPLFFVPVPVPVLMLMLMLMLMCSLSLEVDAAKPAKAAKAAKAGSAKAATAAKATTASATVDASKAVSAPVPAANPQAAPAVIEEIPVAADAREAYGRGQSAFKDGKALFAIRSFLEALKQDPQNIPLMSRTGCLIMDYGETSLKEGRELLTKLMISRKNSATEEELVAYARSLFMVEPFKFNDAEATLRGILKTNPRSASAYVALGDLDLFRNHFENAIENFKQAKTLNSGDKRALFGIAFGLMGLKKNPEALDALQTGLAVSPTDPWVNVRMGRGLVALGQPIAGSRHFKMAIEADPDYLPAHLAYIAQLLPNVGDMTAWRHLQVAQRLDPENPQVYYYLGIFQEMRGHVDLAVENYEVAESFGPQSVEVKLRLARIFAGIGHSFPGNVFSNEDFMAQKEYQLFYDGQRALGLLREVQALAPNHPDSAFINSTIEKLENSVSRGQENK